jgi:hypothetical protein
VFALAAGLVVALGGPAAAQPDVRRCRYDRGGVARGSVAWAVSRRLRVDGFLDSAYVHDPGFGSGLRSYSGLGAAVEVPAPFGMLAAVEWGYGIQGVNASGRRGTQVVRVSALKIF